MTPRELLIQEIEQVPDTLVEEMLTLLRLTKMQHYRQQVPEQPFAAFVTELISDIPADILDTLPSDGAVEHDHYIYGAPKRALQDK
ncbi:MAG: hypothetical protein WA885_24925 [Phormidesmis sp.]